MSLVARQNNLFAAEDWTVAYKAFTNADYQAYDYDTIMFSRTFQKISMTI